MCLVYFGFQSTHLPVSWWFSLTPGEGRRAGRIGPIYRWRQVQRRAASHLRSHSTLLVTGALVSSPGQALARKHGLAS